MASCFLCGSVDEEYAWFDGKEFFINMIFDFITKNDIHTIYTLNRNMFDDIIEDTVNMVRDAINADLIKVAIYSSPIVALESKLHWNDYYKKAICPFEDELDPMVTYKTLYGWMIDNSEYMITYCIDDSDITINVINEAKEKGIKIFNVVDKLPNKIIQLPQNKKADLLL